MEWKVEQIPELKGYTVEWAEPGSYYLSRRNRIFHSTDLKLPFMPVGVIDAPGWKTAASNIRLAQRLLRFFVYNVIPLSNADIFVTFDKSVGVIRDGKFTVLEGMDRPCRVLRSGCALDTNGDVYFGEYLANNERGEMRVYRYRNGSNRLEIAYTFPAGSIKHIHGIYFDRFTNRLFCMTGDDEKECRIIATSDGFATTETIGEGDETWRAVSALFTDEYFYYGTDAEFRDNEIIQVSRKDYSRTTLGEVNGTVFYSKQIGDDLFFTTTAENAPSQKENVAVIWHVGRDGSCERLITFEKDGWHPTLFMFGTIHFPASNDTMDELYFNVVGVKGDDRTYRIFRDVK